MNYVSAGRHIARQNRIDRFSIVCSCGYAGELVAPLKWGINPVNCPKNCGVKFWRRDGVTPAIYFEKPPAEAIENLDAIMQGLAGEVGHA